ncbi:hypothetical protein ABRQ05_15270 [Pectobacterium actinidiae]|uniref:hypothetical protein n=1 Tax=Pectobacterium actinidiae TaxID=1507808 RepID=UPI0032EAD5D4
MSIPNFTLKISNNSSSNFIAILDCLNPVSDLSSPRRHYEDLRIKLIGKDKPEKLEQNLQLITCKNNQEFFDYFEKLMQRFNTPGFKPIILIHAHGDKKNGLQLPDNSFVEWSKLIKIFSELTEKCDGDLTIISGFCHSYELIKHIPIDNRLPFAFYYGYANTVSAGVVEDEMNIIYQSFINDGGKTLFPLLSTLHIKSFGEFDFIRQFLAPALAMAANPEELSKLAPIFSQGKIRKSVRDQFNGPQRGIDNLIKFIVRNDILAIELIKHYMHDTERKTYTLNAVNDYFSLIRKNRS